MGQENTDNEILERIKDGTSVDPIADVSYLISEITKKCINALKVGQEVQGTPERLLPLAQLAISGDLKKMYSNKTNTDITILVQKAIRSLAEFDLTFPVINEQTDAFARKILEVLKDDSTFIDGLKKIHPEQPLVLFDWVSWVIEEHTFCKEEFEFPEGCNLATITGEIIDLLADEGIISKAHLTQFLSLNTPEDLNT